jgi:hypothetical protein
MVAFARHGSLLLLSICATLLCKASGEGYSILSWLSSVVPDDQVEAPISSHGFQEWDASDVDLPTLSDEPEQPKTRTLKRKKNPLFKGFKSSKAPSFKAPSFKAPSAKKAKKAPSFKAPSFKSGKGSVKAPSGKGSKKAPSGKGSIKAPSGKGSIKAPSGKGKGAAGRRRHRRHRRH